jgi:mRNA-degrading endonuclease toxin of MazEF toxin-antitoxin module
MTDDVLAVPMFSGHRSGYTWVPLDAGEGGILRDSTLFCDEITCLDVDFLTGGPMGGKVDDTILDAVVIAVRRALGEPVRM